MMRENYTKTILPIIAFLIIISCGGGNPGLSDSKLSALMKESVKLSPSFDSYIQLTDTELFQKSIPVGIKYTENRMVDYTNPPLIIDIEHSFNNIRNFKLSDIASTVRYLKLSAVSDSLVLISALNGALSCHIYKNKIFVDAMVGIHVFSEEGSLNDTIYRNMQTKIETYQDLGFMISSVDFNAGNRMCVLGNNLIYVTKEASSNESALLISFYNIEKEIKEKIIRIHNPSNRFPSGIFTVNDTVFALQYPTVLTDEKYMVRTFGIQADTLCEFTHYEQVDDFKGQNYVQPEIDWGYYFQNRFFYRHGCSDTVYSFNDAKRIVPTYIFKLGKYKADINDVVRDNTLGKIILGKGFETKNYLVFDYTINRDTPNNRKINIVKKYNAIFDKKTQVLSNSKSPFKNDLDKGIDFWPQFTTQTGEMGMIINKKTIKQMMDSKTDDIEAWKELDEKVGNYEIVIMLVK